VRGVAGLLLGLLALPAAGEAVVGGPIEKPAALVAGGPIEKPAALVVGGPATSGLACSRSRSLALEGRFEKETRRGPPAEAHGAPLTVAGGAHRESGRSGLAPEDRVPMEGPPTAAGSAASGLPPDFAAALEQAGVRPQQISIWFGEAESGEARFHWLPEVPRNPASVLKVVTTAQALEQLGPGYRWTTRAWARGGVVRDTLDGDLVIEGGGDPRLRREDLRALLEQVRAAGIRQVRGNLVIDRDAFRLPPHDPGAFDGQPQRAYNVGADALLLNFAAQSLNVRADPATSAVLAWLEPAIDGVTLDNQLRPTAGDCGDWRLRPLLQIVGNAPPVRVRLAGEMPTACDSASIDIAPLTGSEYARQMLLQTWREVGGSLTGGVVDGHGSYGTRLLAEVRSAPLAEIVRDINRFSNNVMAEHLWLTAGAETAGWPATRDQAAAATRAWLSAVAPSADDAEALVDSGSGLSRRTRVSAEQLHAVLRRMAVSPLFPEFAASLPIAGADGTAARTRVQAHARLKTGSLNGVRAAAGYVRDAGGRWLSLVVLLEDAPTTGWRELLAWLVERAAATDGPVP
jgi:D-alanyl-D-alanine carboxypeptidase/D-alanyl-D-alanine-endopeptidase (penicillin-binding protein 4)